jgi:hypothetical protein
MKKNKILPLMASLLLAATFTLSCSDNEDDSDQSLPSIRNEASPSDGKYGGSDALPVPDGYIDPLVDTMPPYKEPVYIEIEPGNSNPSVPDAVDGNLDGAWQKGSALLKIGGSSAYLKTGNKEAWGAISYDKSGGSFLPIYQGSELVIGFSYTLNGNALIFSDVTGDILETLSGEWTEYVGTPNPTPNKPDDWKR